MRGDLILNANLHTSAIEEEREISHPLIPFPFTSGHLTRASSYPHEVDSDYLVRGRERVAPVISAKRISALGQHHPAFDLVHQCLGPRRTGRSVDGCD